MSQGLGSSGSSRDYGTNGPPVPAVGFADFSPTEMYNLSETIALNINNMNSGWKTLEKAIKLIGTNKDNQRLRENASETQTSVNQTVEVTTRDLSRLSVVVRRGDKRQKLQVERLTQTFTEAVQKYSSVQKQLAEKMQMHMPKMPMTDFPTTGEEDDDQANLVAQMQAQARKVEFESGLLEERAEYMQEIESKVLDVNQIMRTLAEIAQSQAATVDTIESSIEAGAVNVEAGTEELIKASRYQAKFRRKMLILIAIAIIVGIILTAIIVGSLRR